MYFLAMFRKEDIEKINGWDEEFMKGYAYEDNDFGERWIRAGIPFEIRDEIKALHQYHPRGETIRGGMAVNMQQFHDNTDNGVTYCDKGLKQKK
jgi:GT2 family glycosyltransferase